MELFNFYTAYTQLDELYGIELTPDRFETLGIIAWNKIGNRVMATKSQQFEVKDGIVELPCDVDEIEAITTSLPDFQRTSVSQNSWSMVTELYTEQYINLRKGDRSYLSTPGKFIKYETIDHRTIRVYQKDGFINILYRTIVKDEDDLPLLNSKEVDAIAAYCAYSDTFKKGLMTRDANMVNLSQNLEAKWYRLCDHARTPMYMSQNDFDEIGDAIRSWDRKTYGKSFKPTK